MLIVQYFARIQKKSSRRTRSHFYFQAARFSTHQSALKKIYCFENNIDRSSVAPVRPKWRLAFKQTEWQLRREPKVKKKICIAQNISLRMSILITLLGDVLEIGNEREIMYNHVCYRILKRLFIG